MISRDDWLTALKEAEDAPLPVSDALTVEEFAALIGMKTGAARKRLLLMLAAGTVVQTTKQFRRSDQRIATATAYRLVTP